MIDLHDLKQRPHAYQKAADDKKININIHDFLELLEQKNKILRQMERLRQERNDLAQIGKKKKPSSSVISKGKEIKKVLAGLEKELNLAKFNELSELLSKIPTIPSADTPYGQNDRDNKELGRWGSIPTFDFPIKDHIQLGQELDIIDFARGVKVAGYRGYYLKNEGALLQMALMNFAVHKMVAKGYTPFIPPTLVREFALFGSGYFAGQKFDPEKDEIYQIANSEKLADGSMERESKFLIGTAEPSLLAYYADETIPAEQLPYKMCGFSPCYRSEIGSYGKDTKGIYRVHEFMKVEQVVLAAANIPQAEKIQQEMISLSKELHAELGLPYRAIIICTGDLSVGKYRQIDLEVWIPSRQNYGESGSASIFLDWQSRRLNVRYSDHGHKQFVYMLNNTALASARMIIAILENFQRKDGSVAIPKALHPYMFGVTEIRRK